MYAGCHGLHERCQVGIPRAIHDRYSKRTTDWSADFYFLDWRSLMGLKVRPALSKSAIQVRPRHSVSLGMRRRTSGHIKAFDDVDAEPYLVNSFTQANKSVPLVLPTLLRHQSVEIRNSLLQTLRQRHCRLPAQLLLRLRYIRLPLARVVRRQRLSLEP